MKRALWLLLVGCTASPDPHALEECSITYAANVMPLDGMCETACVDVSLVAIQSNPTCTSSTRGAILGGSGATCHATTASDGSLGCCTLVQHDQDARIPTGTAGVVFYECDL